MVFTFHRLKESVLQLEMGTEELGRVNKAQAHNHHFYFSIFCFKKNIQFNILILLAIF